MKLKLIPAPPTARSGAQVVNVDTGEIVEDVVNVRYEHRVGQLPTLHVSVISPFGAPLTEGDLEAYGVIEPSSEGSTT